MKMEIQIFSVFLALGLDPKTKVRANLDRFIYTLSFFFPQKIFGGL